MHRSPTIIPLSEHERARVRRLQVILGVVKRCDWCERTLPIDAFHRYDAKCCGYCLEEWTEENAG